HYLTTITNASKQMGTLIDDLLQFSRTGRKEVHREKTNMNKLLKEVLEDLKPDIGNRKVDWDIQNLPEIYVDNALLKQVWMNLIDNALKYTRNKEIVKISIGHYEENKHLVFYVHDNGVGFNMQYAHKLFGVFQRLHAQTEFEGIIHKHSGQVWAEAEPDKGATFYFSLPKNKED
ncbi:MAG: ATP-binding protein, partial [Marinilabiliales bacterium]|nr:ATP-binding protein [Marinilabiliales bacterium]